ncbi:MAG: regulator of sigma E protease, partial [Flavobacteriales bacterium]
GSAAHEAGLMAGDRVVSIDGSRIQYFDQISNACSSSPEETLTFVVQRGDEDVTLSLTPERVRVPEPMTRLRTIEIGQAGFTWRAYSAFVHVDANSLAAQAGLRTFDRVVKVGDREVGSYIELAAALRDATGPQELVLRRADAMAAGWMQASVQSVATITLPNGGEPSDLGIRSAESTVFAVEPSSPAALAGFEQGDRVTSWNDQAITATGVLLQRIEGAAEQDHVFSVDRGGQSVQLTLTPEVRTVVAEFRAERLETFIGFAGLRGPQIYAAGNTITVPWPSRLWFALRDAVVETIGFIGAIFMGLLFLMIGQVDSSNLGGPLMIADVANRAAQGGYLSFLQFMAKISINLGMVNLMPIPGLDGGNLALLLAEGIKREPLSYRTRQIIGYVGMVCIILLMVLVFKNDIERYWVDIADWLNS